MAKEKAFKTTQAEVDRDNALWRKWGVEVGFKLGDTLSERKQKRTEAGKAVKKLEEKKKQLANNRRREKRDELKKAGLVVTKKKTADEKLTENILRMLSRRGLRTDRTMRYAVNAIVGAYHLKKK
jgi:hypothetical protein